MQLAVFITIFLCSWWAACPATPAAAQVQEEWVRQVSGAGNLGGNRPAAMAIDPQGNIYVTGSLWGGSTSRNDFATIKYSPAGEELWAQYYAGAGNGNDSPVGLALDGQGNIVVAGISRETTWRNSYTIIKYSPGGEQLWVKHYAGGDVKAVGVDSQNNVYVTGTAPPGSANSNYVTIKYSPDGDLLWKRNFNGTGNDRDEAAAIAVDSQGNAIVTGASWGATTGYDYATIKYSPEGTTLWKRRYSLTIALTAPRPWLRTARATCMSPANRGAARPLTSPPSNTAQPGCGSGRDAPRGVRTNHRLPILGPSRLMARTTSMSPVAECAGTLPSSTIPRGNGSGASGIKQPWPRMTRATFMPPVGLWVPEPASTS